MLQVGQSTLVVRSRDSSFLLLSFELCSRVHFIQVFSIGSVFPTIIIQHLHPCRRGYLSSMETLMLMTPGLWLWPDLLPASDFDLILASSVPLWILWYLTLLATGFDLIFFHHHQATVYIFPWTVIRSTNPPDFWFSLQRCMGEDWSVSPHYQFSLRTRAYRLPFYRHEIPYPYSGYDHLCLSFIFRGHNEWW